MSSLLGITASIIQGSAIGPAAYVVNAGDLVAAVPGNSTCKFADDMYTVHHHPGQQRGDPAYGASQRAEMGRAKQPEAELQQVDRGHLQRPQAKATPCCGRY